MKRTLKHILILTLLLASAACSDWLDISPKTDMKAEDMFKTEAGFRDALTGAYVLMCSPVAYGRNLSYGYLDVLAQYYTSPLENTSAGYEHDMKEAALYNYTEKGEENRILNIWQNHYAAVANINQALLFIDDAGEVFSSAEVQDVYKGEFIALRAWMHFDMLRLFAPSPVMDNGQGLESPAIPYVDEFTNVARPQLTVRETLGKIERDLLQAKGLMTGKEVFTDINPSSPMYNRRQRMNCDAVTSLLARVYLYAGEREKALEQALEIITPSPDGTPGRYRLADNIATASDPLFSTELIFTLDVQNLKELSDPYRQESSTSSVLFMSGEAQENIYRAGSLDREFRMSWLNPLSDQVSFTLTKYKDLKMIPVFKLSELYLIAAECAQGETAFTYLNELRNHRGLASVSSEGDLEQYLYEEYRREFIGEGQLFFYYKRKGYDKVGSLDNVPVQDPGKVYNLPIPTVEMDFGNIKK